jgi:hypothetical protein
MTIGATMFTDANGNPIPALRIGTIVNDTILSSSRESAIPTGATCIEIAATVDCYVSIGASGGTAVSTTSMFFPKGAAQYAVADNQTHLQYIYDTTVGRITITKLY